MTWSLIFQLTSFGRWTWAVYVATHLEDETSRAIIIKDLIGRFAYRARCDLTLRERCANTRFGLAKQRSVSVKQRRGGPVAA